MNSIYESDHYALIPVESPMSKSEAGDIAARGRALASSGAVHVYKGRERIGDLVDICTWCYKHSCQVQSGDGIRKADVTFPAGTVYAGISFNDRGWSLYKSGELSLDDCRVQGRDRSRTSIADLVGGVHKDGSAGWEAGEAKGHAAWANAWQTESRGYHGKWIDGTLQITHGGNHVASVARGVNRTQTMMATAHAIGSHGGTISTQDLGKLVEPNETAPRAPRAGYGRAPTVRKFAESDGSREDANHYRHDPYSGGDDQPPSKLLDPDDGAEVSPYGLADINSIPLAAQSQALENSALLSIWG
jgi:hypothetical protein